MLPSGYLHNTVSASEHGHHQIATSTSIPALSVGPGPERVCYRWSVAMTEQMDAHATYLFDKTLFVVDGSVFDRFIV